MFDIHEKGDYILVMPKIEGKNLPSFVYSKERNIELVKFSSGFSSEAFSALAQECAYLNNQFIAVDYHGGNFLYDPISEKIRMLDLKSRSEDKDDYLIRRFLGLSAYDKLTCFSGDGGIAASQG